MQDRADYSCDQNSPVAPHFSQTRARFLTYPTKALHALDLFSHCSPCLLFHAGLFGVPQILQAYSCLRFLAFDHSFGTQKLCHFLTFSDLSLNVTFSVRPSLSIPLKIITSSSIYISYSPYYVIFLQGVYHYWVSAFYLLIDCLFLLERGQGGLSILFTTISQHLKQCLALTCVHRTTCVQPAFRPSAWLQTFCSSHYSTYLFIFSKFTLSI